MITQFRVQNYKALRDVTLNLTPIHLLIGPNDSGKTSILEALVALCRSVDFDLPTSFIGRWDGADLVSDRNPLEVVRVAAEVSNGEAIKYKLGVKFANMGRVARLYEESVTIGDNEWTLKEQFREHDQSTASHRLNAGDQGWEGRFNIRYERTEAAKVHEALSGVELFRWNARLLSLPCALDRGSGFRMQPSGFGLARVLDAILGFDRERFVKLEDRFKKLFPSIAALRILQTAGFRSQPSEDELIPILSREEGKGIVVRFEGHNKDIPAAHLSEGVLLILAYLAILFSPEPPRLLLVEEPENGIHPERLKEVIGLLRELIREQTHTQVVITSHSPYVVSLFEPEEVTLCRKKDAGEVEVRRLSESKYVREQIDVFNLGEIWTGEGDDRLAEPIPELQEAAR